MKDLIIGEKKIHNICVVGGGNEGLYLLAILGSRRELCVSVLTSRPNVFGEEVKSINTTTGEETVGKILKASSNPSEVIPQADMILVAVPSNAYKCEISLFEDFVTEGTIIGFIPGTGGVEFVANGLLKKKCPIFGSQRVPSGTKVIEPGKVVNSLGSRKDLRLAAIPNSITNDVCSVLGNLLDINTVPLPNYLAVTFTPSNPILHTSRLYSLFKSYEVGQEFDENLSFYKKWDDATSETLLGCNDELQECCKKLVKYDLSQVSSLREHYEIDGVPGNSDVERMTYKISHLIYLKDLVPMNKLENGKYVPNFESRYFTEDFPYGLSIIKAFCEVCGISTPNIDNVLGWYDTFFGKGYYVNGEYSGKGLKSLPLPQNYGIYCINDLYTYYEDVNVLFS